MAATQGTFKLGIGFENWRDVGQNYIHSFGITGKDHWTAGFQHFWLKGRERKLAGDYGDYCLELKAAQANRFAHLPRGGMNYAFHIDASLYAKFLRKFSEGFGVAAHRGQDRRGQDRSDVRLHHRDQARLGRGHRRRPVHRLHRLPRPADRTGAARRLRRLVALALLRQRRRAADRIRRRSLALHALDRARGRLAMAHSAAASRRQRHGLLQPLSSATSRRSRRCWRTSKARC